MLQHGVEYAIQDPFEAVSALARQTHKPFEEVRRVYESELSRLERDARVTTFLQVLATRHTREILARKDT
jgi:hypothetical protein